MATPPNRPDHWPTLKPSGPSDGRRYFNNTLGGIPMETKKLTLTMSLMLSGFTLNAYAINNAPPDASTVTLRISCESGGTEIPNCFNSMAEVDNWLRTVRLTGPSKPTLVDIGPGAFVGWNCGSSDVTLRGAGRDRTVFVPSSTTAFAALRINPGCTNLDVQDMTFDGRGSDGAYGILASNPEAVTTWTNVEVVSNAYGWNEATTTNACTNRGKHMWFSSRIRTEGGASLFQGVSRAYIATCAQSWFWGSEVTAKPDSTHFNAFAIHAQNAEIHLYGSNARLLINQNTSAQSFAGSDGSSGHYLMAALNNSAIHIHGTGLDVEHAGTGISDMLYADSTSHYHANESGFNIHVSGAGKVRRIAGAAQRIEAPYIWKQGTQPPLSMHLNGTSTYFGVQTLISVSGADSYIETDCPVNGNCSLGGNFPHQMIYQEECSDTTENGGPWFDMTTKSCRG